jgi:uncharacterized metal-binding protein YceD (DUF177 family)
MTAKKPNPKTPAPKGDRWVDPLTRPIVAATVPGSGVEVDVVPTAAERAAMAKALDLTKIEPLRATYRLTRRSGGVIVVEGRIVGTVAPVCVVTLEPFDLAIAEPVSLRFIEPAALERHHAAEAGESSGGDDPPDEIENGMIDLGRVTTEFLSLAVPPFPRKPGAELTLADENATDSPFAALSRLKP